jgi:hypothetical protein
MRYALLSTSLMGCWVTAQSSRTVLGPEASRSELRAPVGDTGREVVRLFSTRGYALVDRLPTRTGLTLRFKGNREAVTENAISTQIGSIFVVSIEPAAADRTVVTIDGAPTVEGSAACETDHMTECERLPNMLRKYVDGRAEADVVRGVFAELALEGLVASPAPSTIASGRF